MAHQLGYALSVAQLGVTRHHLISGMRDEIDSSSPIRDGSTLQPADEAHQEQGIWDTIWTGGRQSCTCVRQLLTDLPSWGDLRGCVGLPAVQGTKLASLVLEVRSSCDASSIEVGCNRSLLTCRCSDVRGSVLMARWKHCKSRERPPQHRSKPNYLNISRAFCAGWSCPMSNWC